MPGELSDREHAGQRTSGHVSSMGEAELQRLPSAVPVLHSFVQEVQPRRGSVGGEDRDGPEGSHAPAITAYSEGSSLRINALPMPSASHAGAQRMSDRGIGQSRGTSNVLRQQKPLPFAYVPSPVSPLVPTATERAQTRAKIAAREVQIQALEMSISSLGGTFGAESQEKLARLQPIIEDLNSRILATQKEIANILDAFSAEHQEAEAAVSAQVADLEAQVQILKQKNFRDASALGGRFSYVAESFAAPRWDPCA